MNITREEKKESLTAIVHLKVVKEDYEEKVNETLKDYRKKANVPGFRPGMVPAGYIKKMYGKHVLLEELNKLVSDSLMKYIADEKLNILGDPLPSEDDRKPIDLDEQEEFEFSFELGLAPEIEINLTKKNKYPFFNIVVDEELVQKSVDHYTNRFSVLNPIDLVEADGILTGDIKQVNGEITKDNVKIAVNVIKDDEIKNMFLGRKATDAIEFDIVKAFPNDTELSSLLVVKKEELEGMDPLFIFTINEIGKFVPHQVNEELFQKVFGEEVKTEEEFRGRLKAETEKEFVKDSDFKFILDAKEKLLKAVNPELPVDFLKRWLLIVNKELTQEKIDHEFIHFVDDLKWQIVKDRIIRDNEILVSEDEVMVLAKQNILDTFRNYGIREFPEDQLEGYARETLKKDDQRKRFYEMLYQEKVMEVIKGKVTLDMKEVSLEEFNNLVKEQTEHKH